MQATAAVALAPVEEAASRMVSRARKEAEDHRDAPFVRGRQSPRPSWAQAQGILVVINVVSG